MIMNRIGVLMLLVIFWPNPCVLAAEPAISQTKLQKINDAVEASIKRGECPGAVVVVMHRSQIVFEKAFGNRQAEPETLPMQSDGIFDLASLTKPMATATALMVLHERGKIVWDDPVSKHWPEFGANGKDKVTIDHLLLHTSGLIADNAVKDYESGLADAKRRITELKLEQPSGQKFVYSDVGYIVLGILIEKISGESLDEFTKKNIFEPLGMKDTGYVPSKAVSTRIVPTSKIGDQWLRGTVHDPRARAMGGVAGHAGLFSSSKDIAIYATMLLNKGNVAGKPFLSEKTIQSMIDPIAVPGGYRSRGWDVDTAYSAPRGTLFGKKDGFGHTGFTGTSLWIDVPSQTSVIILTNRVHLTEKTTVTNLRRQIGTIVAEAVGKMPMAKSP